MSTRGTLAFNSNGELVALDTNGNEIILASDEQEIGTELGIPIYSDPANAPQTEGRIIYVDGNGTATKGIYSHDGSSYSRVGVNQWQETGNGEIVPVDGETVGDGTTSANHQSVSTDVGNIDSLFESATDLSLSVSQWRTVSATSDAVITAELRANTDGTTNGFLTFEIDESGGTTPDKSVVAISADKGWGSDADATGSRTFVVPAGSQFRFENSSDPNGKNAVQQVIYHTLS